MPAPLPNPTIGQDPWGATLNARLDNLQAQINTRPTVVDWSASDQGFIAWSYDPMVLFGATALANGVLTLARVAVRDSATVNNLAVNVQNAGVGLVAGQNFAALYNNAGTRIAVTADQSAVWNTTGNKIMPVTAPVAVTAGFYWIALLGNAATPMQPGRAGSTGAGSINTAGATLRFATTGAGLTTTPASFVPAGLTLSGTAWWLGAL